MQHFRHSVLTRIGERRTTASPNPIYLTIAETAHFLRCCRRSVERILQRGYKVGRRTLIKRSDLLAYIRKLRVK